MKISNFVIVLLTFGMVEAHAQTSPTSTTGQALLPAPTAYQAVQQDANSRVWQRETYDQGPNGEVTTNVQSYTELATGLNYFSKGQWTPSLEEINFQPDGTAQAIQGQHQAFFPANIFDGQIELVTPDGIHLKTQPAALSYDDGSNTVLIAVLTNSIGQIINDNQVIYTNAFSGVDADLIYTYTRSGFEQDVVIRAQLPSPASVGLNSQSSRLQVLTEFFNPPQPSETVSTLPEQAGMALTDETLDFGKMQMVPGKAFMIGENSPAARVGKSWVSMEGRQFLVEAVPVAALTNELESLAQPAVQTASVTKWRLASRKLVLPPQHLAKANGHTLKLAKAVVRRKPGVVLDYNTVNMSLTNYTFQGDTTYYISGSVGLFGTNTFEGGTVIKYTNNAGIIIYSPLEINWQAKTYRPVVFTAKDDNSIGDEISGSTGSPTGAYATYALDFEGGNVSLSNVRVAYAQEAFQINSATTGANLTLFDAQIINCLNGIDWNYSGGSATVRNVLFANVQKVFNLLDLVATNTISAENSTFFSNGIVIVPSSYSSSFYPNSPINSFTNCIFANVTNATGMNYGANNGVYNVVGTVPGGTSSYEYPFQTVGGGSYYLENGSAFHNAGTTNIDPDLLADLAAKTTYPPIVYTYMVLSNNLDLSLQAPRDTNSSPDLGYHYDPLDYTFGVVEVLGASITVNAGTAVGFFGIGTDYTYGLAFEYGGPLICNGLANNLIYMVAYNDVQENSTTNWVEPTFAMVTDTFVNGEGTQPDINCEFTDWSIMADDAPHFYFSSSGSTDTVKDCQFHGGQFDVTSQSVGITNCLFERVDMVYGSNGSSVPGIVNNLFWYGTFDLHSITTNILVQNNLFDNTIITTLDLHGRTIQTSKAGYNAYVTNCETLNPVYASDVILTNSPAYETSWFGNFYLPANSPLINAGSTNANFLGLYHFTTQTNQTVEADSIVDIGYHYVATDADGNPLDTNGDGIPDYLEDANGNGIYDAGDIANWLIPNLGSGTVTFTNGLNLYIFEPKSVSQIP